MSAENLIQLPNSFNSTCFACSSENHAGLKMTFMAGEDSVISTITIPEHLCGWSNLAHGGILTTVLDEIMSWSAMHFTKHLVMTKSMNVTFKKSVMVGDSIRAVGKIVKQTNRHELIMEGILYNESQSECVRAEAVFAMLSPKIAKRLGISKDEIPDWIE